MEVNPDIRVLLVGGGQGDSLLKENGAEFDVLDKNLFVKDQIHKNQILAVLFAATMACSLFSD